MFCFKPNIFSNLSGIATKMADLEMENKLIDEFGEFGIDIDGNLGVLGKLTDICRCHSLNPEDIVAKWVTFSDKSKSDFTNITEEILEDFEKNLKKQDKRQAIKKLHTPQRTNTYNMNTMYNIRNNIDDAGDDNIIDSYATTPQSKQSIKRMHTTPDDEVHNKRIASVNTTPGVTAYSPVSYSPATPSLDSTFSDTPSAKYEARTGKGDVVASFNIPDKANIHWKGCLNKPALIKNFDGCSIQEPFKYMFQKLQDKADATNHLICTANQMTGFYMKCNIGQKWVKAANILIMLMSVLNEVINAMAEEMKQGLQIDFENICIQSQEEIPLAGRICCDSVGKINSKSVVLEGSRETSAGQRVPLDLSELKNYSLFPGQIVSMQAKNMSGGMILPSSITGGCRQPFYSATHKNATVNQDHFTLYITCGPYATCDEKILSYTPLNDLCEVIKNEKPDVLIMIGPFVDSKQPLIEKCEVDRPFDEFYEQCRERVEETIRNISTEVIFVPSQRDVFHHYVYPQPPFPKSQKIKMKSDPCTIMVNDVCIGITSTDILFHLGAEEVSSFNVRSDRLGRLANHLLQQHCYYPLHPTHEEVNLDYEQFENAFMPFTPDLLVVPSDLRYFLKDLDGCLCINPGRLVKGQTGGTFVKMLVKPRKPQNLNKSSVVEKSIVQVFRL